MKFLTLAVLATTLLSTSVKADVAVFTSEYGFSTTMAPSLALFACSGVAPLGGDMKLCISGVAINLGLSTLTSLLLLKEEAQHVEADAYNFLAGEEISLALEEQMEKVREAAPELANATDEEIAALIVQLHKIQG